MLKIDDKELKAIWLLLLATIERFERKAASLGLELSISDFANPRRDFLVKLAKKDANGEFSNQFHTSTLKKLLLYDIIKICDAIQNQVDEQLTKQSETYEIVRRKYKVYPKLVPDAPTLSLIAHTSDGLRKTLSALDDKLASIADIDNQAEKLFQLHRSTLDEIWQSIQNIEKYHNDNSRFYLAKSAKALSIIAISLSILFFIIQLTLFWYNNLQPNSEMSPQIERTNELLENILIELSTDQ